jgi:hypothetical protein
MKKILLLMMLCCPMVLAAQNGVTVSGLAIDAGTVTFNVSWKNTNMPELWSDTVWVFVDYNNAGKMERLPLLPGATLTATSPGGEVIEEPDNNKGVWVAGIARTEGSFSATVKLLTEVKDVGGACVYGSNYPPVGEYSSNDATGIKFTGTPMYDLVLEKIADGSTYTIATTGLYSIHAGEVIQSFTDRTAAPGKFSCIPSTVYDLTASASSFCAGGAGVTFALSGTEFGRIYQLYRDGTTVVAAMPGTGSVASFSGMVNEAGTYTALAIALPEYCPTVMAGTIAVSIQLPGAADGDASACGCQPGLTDCAGLCKSFCPIYVDCNTLTEVYPEHWLQTAWEMNAIYSDLSVAGWREPTMAELDCLCEQPNFPSEWRELYLRSGPGCQITNAGAWHYQCSTKTEKCVDFWTTTSYVYVR